MSLRKTVVFTIGITFIGLFSLLMINLSTILSDYFFQQERNSFLFDIQRAQSLIQSEVQNFNSLAVDWLTNNRLTQTADTELNDLRTILESGGADLLKVTYVVALSPQGKIVFTLQRQPTSSELSHPDFLTPFLPLGDQPSTGVVVTRTSTWIVSRQVIKDVSGKTIAVLLLARSMDPSILPGFDIKYFALQDSEIPRDLQTNLGKSTFSASSVINIKESDLIIGYAHLISSFPHTPTVLKLSQPRSVYRNGQLMINYLILFLVLSSIIFAIIMLILMERLVLSRILRLSHEVSRITQESNPSRRVSVDRSDELSRLSVNINSLLESLQKSSSEQAESLLALSKLEQDLRDQVDRLEKLHKISRSFLPQSDAPVAISEITRQAVEKMDCTCAYLLLLSTNEAPGIILSQSGTPCPSSDESMLFELANNAWRSHAPIEESERIAFLLYETEVGAYVFAAVVPSSVAVHQSEFLQAFINLAEIKLQSAFLFEAVRNGRETLAALSQRLVEIQEEERRAIAQELHDEIGQILTGLKLLIDSTSRQNPSQVRSTLVNAQSIVNELIGRVRQMSLDLRPAMLDDLGLLPGLLWLFERYHQQTGIIIQFSHTGIEGNRFPPSHETAVYRVIQEALTNVARHAKTNQVFIHLWKNPASLSARIEDRGEGFDLNATLNPPKTRGLLGIRERIAFLKGTYNIDSSIGQGTSLAIELPLPE